MTHNTRHVDLIALPQNGMKQIVEMSSFSLEDHFFLFIMSLEVFSGLIGIDNVEKALEISLVGMNSLDRQWVTINDEIGHLPVKISRTSAVYGLTFLYRLAKQELGVREWRAEIDQSKPVVRQLGIATTTDAKRRFRAWLRSVGKELQLPSPLSLRKLDKAVREHYFQFFPEEVELARLLNRQTPYPPAGLDQEADYAQLAKPLCMESIQDLENQRLCKLVSQKPLPHLQRSPRIRRDGQKEKPVEIRDALSLFPFLRSLLRDYRQKANDPDSGTLLSKAYYRELNDQLAGELREHARKSKRDWDRSLAGIGNLTGQKTGSFLLLDQFEMKTEYFLCEWLLSLADSRRVYSPNTVYRQFSDLMAFIRFSREPNADQLSYQDLLFLKERLKYRPGSLNQLLITLRQFRRFLNRELGITISADHDLQWDLVFEKVRRMAFTKLIMPEEIEKLLTCLLTFGELGRMAYFAAIIQLLTGCRGSAACDISKDSITFSDRWMDVKLPHSKNKDFQNLQIPISELDLGLVNDLKGFIDERLKGGNESRTVVENHGADSDHRYLLELPHGKRLDYSRYANILSRAKVYTRVDASSHALRHFAANRWLSMGVRPINIRNRLGHNQLSTTLEVYLHGQHFELAKRLVPVFEHCDHKKITRRLAASLLGVSERSLYSLIKRNCEYRETYMPLSYEEFFKIVKVVVNTRNR